MLKAMWQDWRSFIAVYILFAGIWGVLVKYASDSLNVSTVIFTSLTVSYFMVVLFTVNQLQWQSTVGIVAAGIGGGFAGMGNLAFFIALKQAPAAAVIPLSSLSIVVTVVLAYFFLHEVLTPRQYLGIGFGLLSIYLLAK